MARAEVRETLIKISQTADAARILGLPAGLSAELERNARLVRAPGATAAKVYTGVLYEALGLDTLSVVGRRRATKSVRVQSALLGPVSPSDRITAYRLSMGVNLPGLGPLASWWRRRLTEPMESLAGGGVVVDCRSSSYVGAWLPADPSRRVAVRVFTEVDGRRTVVSHLAKHTRGLVARLLLGADRPPRTPAAVAELVGVNYRCELVDQGRHGISLDVIT